MQPFGSFNASDTAIVEFEQAKPWELTMRRVQSGTSRLTSGHQDVPRALYFAVIQAVHSTYVRYGMVWYGMDVCIYLQKIVEISMIIYESNYFDLFCIFSSTLPMKMSPTQGQGRVASHKDNSTQKLWHTLEILQQFSVWATCEYCAVVSYK